MDTRIFTPYDPETGIERLWHYDRATDQTHVQTRQSVTDLIEANKYDYNETERPGKDVHRVASIPLSKYFELKAEGIIDDPDRLTRWLNDPDNRYFRTRPGRV